MERKIALIKKLVTVTSVITLILSLSSCKKETFNSGITRLLNLQSAANSASYDIKVDSPADFKPSGEKHATIYVLDEKEIFESVYHTIQIK